jgi:outer membrane protein TolC
VSAKNVITLATLMLLTGCATFSNDNGFDRVAELTKERVGQAPRWSRTPSDRQVVDARTAELLATPLTADASVELALLNNAGLQAGFHALGVAEADLVRAGRVPNPSFSFTNVAGGGHREIERAILFDVLGLLTMPLALSAEQARFGETQFRVAGEAVAIAAEARRAHYQAVASAQLAAYYEQVKETADTAAELARRMVQAGNFSKLAQMREQAFYADATAQLARARHQAIADRERLIRVLGLAGERAIRLPARLPDLPKEALRPSSAEQTALDRRLDVLQSRRDTDALAKSLELTRKTGFINVLHVGYANKSATDEPRANGYEIELEVPLFDFGTTRIARAEATYMQAVHRMSHVALRAVSEVRESYSAYRTAYDLAAHYRDEIVPLRKRISEEALLRYNGMLIGVFELLADAREQVSTVVASVEAQRDFWLADTNLQVALTSGSPGATSLPRPSGSQADAGAAH